MFEQFHGGEFGTQHPIEQLEQGILLERFELRQEIAEDEYLPEDAVYGETEPGPDALEALQEIWQFPANNITLTDMDMLFREKGVEVYQTEGCRFSELLERLGDGESVLCLVSGLLLEYPQAETWPGVAADRAVVVLGVDMWDAEDAKVYLYDAEQSACRSYPLQDFLTAWDCSERYAYTLS